MRDDSSRRTLRPGARRLAWESPGTVLTPGWNGRPNSTESLTTPRVVRSRRSCGTTANRTATNSRSFGRSMMWCCRSPTREHTTSGLRFPCKSWAEYWVAYYWPFVDSRAPVSQGPHSLRNGTLAIDMAFRPALATLREAWQEVVGEAVRPSDGFFLINEFRVARRRAGYPPGSASGIRAGGQHRRSIDRTADSLRRS
jgi:hypothetical protein